VVPAVAGEQPFPVHQPALTTTIVRGFIAAIIGDISR